MLLSSPKKTLCVVLPRSMATLAPDLQRAGNFPPNRDGNDLQCLENDMRSCNIVFRLALRGYSADFVCGSIVAFTAGRLAFVAARGGRHPSPTAIADSIRPASSASVKSPAKAADRFRPAPSSSHPDNSRSRRHSRRRLAREEAAGAKAAAEAVRLRQVETDAAEQVAAQHRQVEIAAAEEAAAQHRQVEIAAAEEAAAQRRQVETAAAEEAATATQRRQEETGVAEEAAQRRQRAIDSFRRGAAEVGTTRRWQWARVDGRLSRPEAQRRQDAIDALQHDVIVLTSPTSGTERLRWGRFDGRSPGRRIRSTANLPTVAAITSASRRDASDATLVDSA